MIGLVNSILFPNGMVLFVCGFLFYLPLLDINEILRTIYKLKTQIRQKLYILEKTLERHIKILRDAGLIEYKGSKKTGGYYIVMIELLAMRE